jgi:hypothetical protein
VFLFVKSADNILLSLWNDITIMQNTVIEHKALSLSGSVYFNSTTKYVKPISPQPTSQNKPQSPPPTQSVFADGNHQNQSSVHLSSLIFRSSPPTANAKL